jgi:type II restriction enzyme methylase subunits-like protein
MWEGVAVAVAYSKKELREFAERWRGRGYEKGETQQFWLQALRAIGYPHVDDVLFEYHLPSGGFVDVWIPDADVLIEQKSFGVNLDDYELRQKKKKTPLMQALDYVEELPRPKQPRFVVTCNFGIFRVYDRDMWSKSQLVDNAFEFTLDELAEHPEYMAFITDPDNSRLEKEKQVSIKAGKLIGQLYDMMREGYIDPDNEESMHALNVLCVRLVFCLYCEDADLFEKDSFYNYLKDVPASQFRTALRRLFVALDTDLKKRDPYDTDVKIFPYVNGGLFREDTEIPNFTEEAKQFLLEKVARPVNWSQISPTIFGGIFESTLNPKTRRSAGMHYTSPENIHKVIDPLFLDDLKVEFAAIRDEEGATPRKKKNALARFHAKLCSLKFFDPACGSGNFLTETYICLRKLEDAVLNELRQGQTEFGFVDDEVGGRRVSLNQFYGIEINDFAVKVAESALWISRLKANGENFMFYEGRDNDFPLNESANIVESNALRIDWNDILPAIECSFVMGNPPFVGFKQASAAQKDDMHTIFGPQAKLLDYVCAWFMKAGEYMQNTSCHAAFVSTNSVCQGKMAADLWSQLQPSFGVQIDFAHRTFVWDSEASEKASVHCVVVGFSQEGVSEKRLYIENEEHIVQNINCYLIDFEDVYIMSRTKPLCEVPPIIMGNQAMDGGNLIIGAAEYDEFIRRQPEAAPYIKRYMMGDEFINGKVRWCLWLVGVSDDVLNSMALVRERVERVRAKRADSDDLGARKKAATPHLFREQRNPEHFVAIPITSSQNRDYVPIGYLDDGVIAGNTLFIIEEVGIYEFGILTSWFHNSWMRAVGARMKSDYRYSKEIVYNNFVWPDPTDEQRRSVESCAQAVLDARLNHSDHTLATLYDHLKMPDDLRLAHERLDAAVEAAYGVDFGSNEDKIVAHLFKLYLAATAKE